MSSWFAPLSDIFLTVLEFIHENFGLTWGWSIVILTILVRLILLPLTIRQMKSMRSMQVLQPQLKALQEKYKHDRQLLNQKMMEFYKENKFNPFGSCLPLLLQMPVFIALFYMLRGAEAEGVFVVDNQWLWIRDWSGASSEFLARNITEFDLPLLLLYVGSQFLSSKIMMANRDSTQAAMIYAMPIGIGVIMFIGRWPAGLFIYWFTSNMWQIGQQFVINRTLPAPAAAGAAAAVIEAEPAGGKGGGQQTKRKSSKGKRGNR